MVPTGICFLSLGNFSICTENTTSFAMQQMQTCNQRMPKNSFQLSQIILINNQLQILKIFKSYKFVH